MDGTARTDALPARVRVVLTRIAPLMEEQNYQGAATMITDLQSRSTPPDGGAMSRSVYRHPELYFVLGNCYLLQGLYPEAIQAYRTTLAGAPSHVYGWLNLAKAYYEEQDFLKAGDCFKQGYENSKVKDPETLYYSAASFLMGEQYQLANDEFGQLQQNHAENFRPEWKEYYVHSLLAADRPEEAVLVIRELIDLYNGEKRLQWQEILLHHYMQFQDSKAALEYIGELTQESPLVAKWWKAAAHIELELNSYENALAALIVYSFLSPLDTDEQQLLADLFLQVGIPAKAAPLYTSHLQDSGNPEILYRLALAYDQLGQPDKSLQLLGKNKITEKNFDLLMLQGELFYRLHQYREARIRFTRAAGCDKGKSGKALLMAGYAALQLEDFAEGRKLLVRAAQFKTEKRAAAKALAQLEKAAMAWTNSTDKNL